MPRRYSKILVTGGAGFIGSHIIDRLLTYDYEVTVIDNLQTGRLENLARHQGGEEFHVVKGDIRDLDLVKELVENVDAVFHEAAQASVALSVENPILTHDVNVTGTLNLLKVCLDSGVRRFIFASSAAVYGKTETVPMREDSMLRPTSPYGVSKMAAESYVRNFYETYGFETVSLRYFNVYGPRQLGNHGAINIFVSRILNNQPPIIQGDGEQTRDFVNIQDVVDANMLALNSKNAVGEIINIGTGTPISLNQLADMILRVLGKTDLKPLHTDPRPGDIKHGYADITKARRALRYDPKVALKEGIAKFIEWCTSRSM